MSLPRKLVSRGIQIRIHCTPSPPHPVTPPPPHASVPLPSRGWVTRVLGGLLAASETLPFLDGESNGILHSWLNRQKPQTQNITTDNKNQS